jgi:hypothetical protein
MPVRQPQAYVRGCVPVAQGIYPDLVLYWDFVRRGLALIKSRQQHASFWEPEHVRASIVAGQSELWLAFADGGMIERPVGFTVTQVTTDPFIHVPTSLFVWMAWKEPSDRTNVVAAMDEHITQVARERGLRHLEALTARPGLGRRMRRHGWEVAMEVVRKDLYKRSV